MVDAAAKTASPELVEHPRKKLQEAPSRTARRMQADRGMEVPEELFEASSSQRLACLASLRAAVGAWPFSEEGGGRPRLESWHLGDEAQATSVKALLATLGIDSGVGTWESASAGRRGHSVVVEHGLVGEDA